MDLKERIDINIVDLINRIDRLTSGNVGHAKTQLKFQIKKVGEFVTELCDNQKSDTGDRQLTIPVFINWVSVTERMPDLEWGDYMVCLENNAILIANYSRIGTERWLRVGIGEIKNTNPVKYWTELPEPPCL